MTKNRISTTVKTTVQLGGATYGKTLTITANGMVTPRAAGTDGIIGDQAADKVTNRGTIVAAIGGAGGTDGGVGIDLTAGGTIINQGSIAGGTTKSEFKPINGGDGVDISVGTITNSGSIMGGALNVDGNSKGQGGTGVNATAGSVSITNSGKIEGGNGVTVVAGVASGGIGVDLAGGGSLVNTGSIDGGYTRFGSGIAVQLAQNSTLDNQQTIIGGNETSGAAVVSTNSQISNEGLIRGVGYLYNARGAVGVSITGGSLNNTALIEGGKGGYGDKASFAAGTGIDASAAEITNSGTILAGSNTYSYGMPGANGLNLVAKSSLSNTGTISGGFGGGAPYANGGAGGIGVSLDSATGTSSGLIEGGDGGSGGSEGRYNGGAGGVGVSLTNDSEFSNSGKIIGGAGGYGRITGHGGDGVDINGGTLTTGGTIIGGAGPGAHGDAVNFGGVAGTLIIEPGAVFKGDIVGSYSTRDMLVLAGTSAGTLTGFGSAITGIKDITENATANWSIQGTIAGPGEVDIGQGAQLTLIGGSVSISTIAFATGGDGTLTLGSPASVTSTFSIFGQGDQIDLSSVQGTSLSFADGTLTVLGAQNAVLATLDFAGDYTLSDFMLQTQGGNTDILYAGSLPDFAPPAIGAQPAAPVGGRGPVQFGGREWLDTGAGLAHLWPLHF